MSWAYVTYEFPFPHVFNKELLWTDKNCNVYFAFKLNDTDEWSFFAGNETHALVSPGNLLTAYGMSETAAQTNYLTTSRDTNGKILAVLPMNFQAKYARLYVETGNNVKLYEWHPSTYLTAHDIVTGELLITDKLSDAPVIRVVKSDVDRLKLGNISGYYGLVGYDSSSNKIFELSDYQQMLAGWKFDSTKIYKDDGLTIDASLKAIYSNDYVSGPLGSGWRIDTQKAEFQNIIARGILKCTVFEKDTISVVNGMTLVTKGDVLSADMLGSCGSNVLTSWSQFGYDTFTSIGANITSAITAVGSSWAYCHLSLTSGHTYRVDINLSLASGSVPRISTGINTGDSGGIYDLPITHLTSGTNTLSFAYTGTADYFWIGNDSGESSNYSATFTIYDVSQSMTIKGETTFDDNEVIRIKDGTNDEWLLVTETSSAPTYTVTRDIAFSHPASTPPAWTIGSVVAGMAGTNKGFLLMDSSSTVSPVFQIFKRNSTVYSDYSEVLRLGNLEGFLSCPSGAYGIAVGDGSQYLKYYPALGLEVKGTITGSVITGTSISGGTIIGSVFKTAEIGQRIEINSEGISLIMGGDAFMYGAGYYWDGLYDWGPTTLAYINNTAKKVPFYINAESDYADFHFYNRSSNPTYGEAGDMAVVNAVPKICVAGTPTWYSCVLADANGYVGLGVSDPQSRLEIKGATGTHLDGIFLSDSVVDHGMTTLTHTDTYARFTIRDATNGGCNLIGMSDGDMIGLGLYGLMGATDPTDTNPALMLVGGKKSGTSYGSMGDAETVLAVRNGTTTDIWSLLGKGVQQLTAGLKFPASVNLSSDVNTLDDYEEGSFTCSLVPQTSGSITLRTSYRTGYYTKIGNVVHWQASLKVETVSSPVGWLRITGLPFTSMSMSQAVSVVMDYALGTCTTSVCGMVLSGTTQCALYDFTAGNIGAIAADMQVDTYMQVGGMYFTTE